MTNFRELITATPEKLVNIFYKIKPAPTQEFLVRINWAATQLELNHAQMVCGIGFNPCAREMTDVLTVIGFSAFKPLGYRRDELFATDAYSQLLIDDILEIYTCVASDNELLNAVREGLARRLAGIEQTLGNSEDPVQAISYRMEIHALYNGGIAGLQFAQERLKSDNGHHRLVANELEVIINVGLLPPSNAFFMDQVLPEEKRMLIEKDLIPAQMIRNRLSNTDISEEERRILSEFQR